MVLHSVRHFFAPDGPLQRSLPGYETRRAQVDVAEAVQRALADDTQLVAEAGTGTGKTLAYLIPALASGRKIVISTGTKNLQDQLVQKDLPLAQRALGKRFAVEVMKGRTNYLCELRAERAFAQAFLPGMPGGAHWDNLREWRQRTDSGDRAELRDLPDDTPLWRHVSATSEQCLGRACSHYERCWVTQMRRRAQTADVVITNHHLYLADAALRQSRGDDAKTLIPAHDFAIFDEAHELDDIAGQHFGYQVSERRLHELQRDVGTTVGGRGLLTQRVGPILTELQQRSHLLYEALPFNPDGRLRLRDDFLTDALRGHQAAVDHVLQRLEADLSSAEADEVKALARRAAALAAELAFVLGLPARHSLVTEQRCDDSVPYVRYSEVAGRERSVVARPVDVAPLLGRVLTRTPAVFLSATLRVGSTFKHFRRRVGIGESTDLCVASPFDYDKQAHLYVPQDLPDPDHPDFAAAAAARTAALAHRSGGGAFVLCTSHRAIHDMRVALQRSRVGPVWVQGDGPKSYLIDAFRNHGNGVLVATMSFWKGVDVPGAALRLVIIDKLPFASPTDPWVQARVEHMVAQGLDPFMAFQLPHAALLLRQGFGRLIRTQRDKGLVAVLDRRLWSRRYGPLLLRSLPACQRVKDWAHAAQILNALRSELTDTDRTPRETALEHGA